MRIKNVEIDFSFKNLKQFYIINVKIYMYINIHKF